MIKFATIAGCVCVGLALVVSIANTAVSLVIQLGALGILILVGITWYNPNPSNKGTNDEETD